MPNVGELMENPELLKQEAERVAQLCVEEQNREREPWDQGPNAITSEEQLCEIFNGIGHNTDVDYSKLCEIDDEN